MRKLILFLHTSLDGFAAGPNGEIDWIHVDDEIFDHVGTRVNQGDTALYGRVTYQMMEAYWPTAAAKPSATRHDIEHGRWYNRVAKVVVSRSMKGAKLPNTTIVNDNLAVDIKALKQAPGKDILIFGSPSAGHALMAEDLIDGFWFFINPILLGRGIPVFTALKDRAALTLVESKVFSSGVICGHYERKLDG